MINENTQKYDKPGFANFWPIRHNFLFIFAKFVSSYFVLVVAKQTFINDGYAKESLFSDEIFLICIYIESQSRVKRPENIPSQVLNTLSQRFLCTTQQFLL